MNRLLRAAFVIARRDYVATVWSRTFLLFLIGPLLPLIFGGLFGAITAGEDEPRTRSVAVTMARADVQALLAARKRLADRLGPTALPRLAPGPAGEDQASLGGTLDSAIFTEPNEASGELEDRVALIVDQARVARTAGAALPAPIRLRINIPETTPRIDKGGTDLARGAQFVLFFLTMLLAGMTISNLVEEKSSKVIETLAAAVPIDAIFLGKLLGMLAVSLTGIAVWTTAGAVTATLLPPALALPAPAIGWPLFLLLGILYFATVYLLLGALYLGIGAQAGSVREVQTLSMPLTMGQLLIFGLASVSAPKPESPLALLAAFIPWTSPFAMLARGALKPDLWPHLLALTWQTAALLLMIRIGGRLFRRNVLKSGRGSPSPQP